MLRTRLVTAAVLAPLILAVVVLGEPWLSLLVGVAAFLAFVELVALLDAGEFQPPQVLTIVFGMALAAAGLVTATRRGQHVVYELVPQAVADLVGELAELARPAKRGRARRPG